MDWQTILISIVGSSTVSGILIFILKKSFEKSLEIHSSKVVEENKSMIHESYRRKAFMYDMQLDALQLSISLVYRLRNAFRELTLMDFDDDDILVVADKTLNYHNALTELLYEKRGILPEEAFEKIHSIKSTVTGIRSALRFIIRSREMHLEETNSLTDKKTYLVESYKVLDQTYSELVPIVKKALTET